MQFACWCYCEVETVHFLPEYIDYQWWAQFFLRSLATAKIMYRVEPFAFLSGQERTTAAFPAAGLLLSRWTQWMRESHAKQPVSSFHALSNKLRRVQMFIAFQRLLPVKVKWAESFYISPTISCCNSYYLFIDNTLRAHWSTLQRGGARYNKYTQKVH